MIAVSFDVYREVELEGVEEPMTLLLVGYSDDASPAEITEVQRAVSGVLVESPRYLPLAPEASYFTDRFPGKENSPPVELHTFRYFFATSPGYGTYASVQRADNGYLETETPEGRKASKIVVALPNSLGEVREGLLEKTEKRIARNLGFA